MKPVTKVVKTDYCSAIDCALHIEFSGNVRPCCSAKFGFGNVTVDDIDTIRSRQVQSKELCETCEIIEEQSPVTSQRYTFNNTYGVRENKDLKNIDIRWSNICNLSCRYCDTYSSSKWRMLFNRPKNNDSWSDNLLEDLKNRLHTVDSVFLVGGEPLLQKPNLRLLDMLDPSTNIDILTNASVNFNKNAIYEKLKKFKNINWNLSFDNVGDRFEYVRAGGDWSRLCMNLEILKDDFGVNNITFHPIYHIWNATRLQEYYEFRNEIDTGINVNWQAVNARTDEHASNSFQVHGHNHKIIQLAIDEIDRLNLNNQYLDDSKFLTNTKNFLIAQSEQPQKAQDFLQWIKKNENFVIPKYSFNLLWPELYNIMIVQ